jgi:sugar (pentulose or hexulose) kinase
VAVAGHDTASAAAAVPFIDDDCAFISSGTWSCLGVVQDGPTTSAEAKRHGFINEFGVDSILFLKNLAGLYLFENLRRAEMRKGQAPTYARMIRQAAGARPFARMINVNSPVFFVADDPVASVKDFLKRTGQGPGVALAEMTRGILEGVAFSYRQAFADLQHVTGRKLRRICMVGGGIRNGMLCQMTADATGLEVVAGPAEATVAGNLGLQALATGRLRCIADIRELVRRSFRLRTYRPRSAELWNKHAQRHAEVVGKSARLK